jgi:hypothetical protein
MHLILCPCVRVSVCPCVRVSVCPCVCVSVCPCGRVSPRLFKRNKKNRALFLKVRTLVSTSQKIQPVCFKLNLQVL